MASGSDGCDAPFVVFVHGLLGWPQVMEPLARPLAEAGARTSVLELRGARQSWSGTGDETWHEWVDQATGAVLHAKQSASQVFLVGAFGGALLAAIAAAGTGPTGAMLLCPPLSVEDPASFLRRRGGLLGAISRLGAGRRRDSGKRHGGGAGGDRRASGRDSGGGNGPPAVLRANGRGTFPDGDLPPATAALERNLRSLQDACQAVISTIRCPVAVAYPRRGGLNPEGGMDAAHKTLRAAAARELVWLDSPEEVYGSAGSERVYRFVSRYAPSLPLLPIDSDLSRLEAVVRSMEPRVRAAVQRAVDVGETGPCQVASFLATEWLLLEGYDALMAGAVAGSGSTDVADHYWTEVHLGREWYAVDFTSSGPLDVRALIRSREAGAKDGYVAGHLIELRLPSVRQKIAAEIRAYNPGLDQHLRELG